MRQGLTYHISELQGKGTLKGDPKRKEGVKPRDGTVYETDAGGKKESTQLASDLQEIKGCCTASCEPKTVWKDRAILQGPRTCHA